MKGHDLSITPKRGLRIGVCMPTHEMVPAVTMYDLAQLMGYHAANHVGPDRPIESIALCVLTGTYVHSARQELAEMAVEQEMDYVLWLDGDMRFPKDALWRLLKHGKDIVGANYSKRGVPPGFVAIKQRAPAQQCITAPDSTGLEEVEAIGFGCVLMRTRVLLALDPVERSGHPWFWFDMAGSSKGPAMVGEDVFFCQLVRDAGFKVYVDHDFSKDCAHVGMLEYTLDHAYHLGGEKADAIAAETVPEVVPQAAPEVVGV